MQPQRVSLDRDSVSLPWWTWVAPFVVCHIGVWLSVWIRTEHDAMLWYLPTALGTVMVMWWGLRVLPAMYLNAIVIAFLWPDIPLVLAPFLALVEVLEVFLAWLLFQRIAGGRCWLPDLRAMLLFIVFAIGIPSALAIAFAVGQIFLSGHFKAGNLGREYLILLTTVLSGHVVVGIPMLTFLTGPMARRGWARVDGDPPQVVLLAEGRKSKFEVSLVAVVWMIIFVISMAVIPPYSRPLYGVANLVIALRYGAPLSMLTTSWTVILAVITPLLVSGGANMINWNLKNTLDINSAILLLGIVIITARTVSDLTLSAQRSARGERRERFMRRELDHRVKNNLASMLGLIDETLDSADSLEQFGVTFRGRIHAMVEAQRLIASSQLHGLDLRRLVEAMLAPYTPDAPGRVTLSGDSIAIPVKVITSLSMVLHELGTNAFKHGALANKQCALEINWSSNGDNVLLLHWRENIGPAFADHVRDMDETSGYGVDLILGLVQHDLGGQIDFDLAENGLNCDIQIPLGSTESTRG